MVTRRLFLAIVALVIATLACQGDGSTPQATSVPLDTQATQSTEEVSSTSDVSPTSNSLESRCELDKWEIIPTDILLQPDSQGWKYILVQFALMNNSQYWGKPAIGASFTGFGNDEFITTEEGFTYPSIPVEVLSFDPPFNSFVESRMPALAWIPPSFAVSGNLKEGRPQMLFKVAESQSHFKLTIPALYFRCLINGEDIYDESGPVVLDLDKDTRTISYPTTDGAATNINEAIETDLGTFQFLKSVQEDDKEKYYFNFTNASSGYGAFGQIGGHLIGNDGMIREPCGASNIEAGPGQSSEVWICFPITRDVGNRYLVLSFLDANFKPINDIGVYKLP